MKRRGEKSLRAEEPMTLKVGAAEKRTEVTIIWGRRLVRWRVWMA